MLIGPLIQLGWTSFGCRIRLACLEYILCLWVGRSYVGNDVTHSTLLDRACACSYENLPKYRSYRVSNTAPGFYTMRIRNLFRQGISPRTFGSAVSVPTAGSSRLLVMHQTVHLYLRNRSTLLCFCICAIYFSALYHNARRDIGPYYIFVFIT